MTEQHNTLDEWSDPDHTVVTDDPWHAHAEEAPPQHSHGSVSAAVIFAIGMVGFLLVVLCVALITVYFKKVSQAEYAAKQEVPLNKEYRENMAQWTARLDDYAWSDAENDLVQTPIEVAIDKVARRYAEEN